MKTITAGVAAALLSVAAAPAFAQVSGDAVEIGVMSDMAGAIKDTGGPGSALAAQMAVEDFGGTVLGKPVRLRQGDFQLKPDIASSLARQWFDQGVDMIVDLPVSAAARAVVEIARDRKKVTMVSGATATDLTGAWCSPYNVHWVEDTHALAVGAASAQVEAGNDSWYFITSDIAFGHAIERDAEATIEGKGGKVLGAVRFPFPNADFSSYLLQAMGTDAKAIGLSSAGTDTVTAIKQAHEFRVTDSKEMTAFVVFITDIHSLGLELAKGISFVSGFYWDQNDETRKFAERFYDKMNAMPTKEQAGTYGAVLAYLRAVEAARTDDGEAVSKKLREMPIDYFGQTGTIRPDGRFVYDVALYKAKSPGESKRPWDYYQQVAVIDGGTAFMAPADNGCYLNK